jgi:hypothetical protein
MAWTISCDSFTWLCLLSFGLLFVEALRTRGNGRSPTGVVERGVDRPTARPDRIADRVPGRLTETGPGCGRTRVRESDTDQKDPLHRLGGVGGRRRTPATQVDPTGVGLIPDPYDIPSLQRYARRFEEAIEKIRLSRQGLRRRGDR